MLDTTVATETSQEDSTDQTTDTVPRPARSERRCIVTNETRSKSDLIRFALSPDNIVTPDLAEKLPGRGVWLCAERKTLLLAIQNNLFNKAFKCDVSCPDNFIDMISRLIERRCLDSLNIARRSGETILGFDKAYEAAKTFKVAAYITAAAPESDSRRKIISALKDQGAEIVTIWNSDDLSSNFGTDNTNHVILKQSGIAKKFIKEYRKLRALGV